MSNATTAPVSIDEYVLDAIRSFVDEPDLVEPESPLEALEVDSLDLMELTQMVEEEFGVVVEKRSWRDVVTVNDAAAVVREAFAA